MPLPVYRGAFGKPQAERLLWRAGFGPRPGEAERLAKLGLHKAVHSLTHPGRERLKGPKPHDDNGHTLAPYDAWGHDQLWWLDRMIRTRRPLVERMALVWHDWFATSREGVDSARLMLKQNGLFRKQGLGSFLNLATEVTRDPAMLLWLSGTDNSKDSPNENYGRELMELFTLGADQAAGRDAARPPAALRLDRLRDPPGRRGDPRAPRPLHGAANGQVAGGLHRGPAACAQARDRRRGVDVADEPRRPAALLPAQRRRLGRLALARHRDLPRPLDDRAVRDPAAHARQRQGTPARRRGEAAAPSGALPPR